MPDVYDMTAEKYLPVGEKVEIPKGNTLEIKHVTARTAGLDTMTVNGEAVADGAKIIAEQDMVIQGTFKPYSGPDTSKEESNVYAVPLAHPGTEPRVVSRKLVFMYYDGATETELSGATFGDTAAKMGGAKLPAMYSHETID